MSNNELWTNFREMLKDIKSNPLKVEQNDSPSEHIFGYKAIGDDKVWQIKASDINLTFGDAVVNSDGLFQIISTDSGKQKLLETLNEGK